MIRLILPYALTALVGGVGVWWVMDLRADNVAQAATIDAQADTIATLEANAALIEQRARADRAAQEFAWFQASRLAERNRDLQAQLATFKDGTDCDPTDPACAIDFIDRILRGAGNGDGIPGRADDDP